MSVARSYIRGPRFALRSTDPAKVRACIKCIYGNGEHAEWCEKGKIERASPAIPAAPQLIAPASEVFNLALSLAGLREKQ
jgi:hypothetical protein